MKEFADKFSFDESGSHLLKWVENTVGKRRNCSLRAISPFPTVFSKNLFSRQIKTGLVWERVKLIITYVAFKIIKFLKIGLGIFITIVAE